MFKGGFVMFLQRGRDFCTAVLLTAVVGASSLYAQAATPATPTDLGVDVGGTIANAGSQFGTYLVAGMALAVSVMLLISGFGFIRRGIKGRI